MISNLMQTSVTWHSIDVFVVGISGNLKANFGYKWNLKLILATNVFGFSKSLFRLLYLCVKSRRMRRIFFRGIKFYSYVFRLVCSLGNELKKLTSVSEESVTSRTFSELNGLKLKFSKSWAVLSAIFRV